MHHLTLTFYSKVHNMHVHVLSQLIVYLPTIQDLPQIYHKTTIQPSTKHQIPIFLIC